MSSREAIVSSMRETDDEERSLRPKRLEEMVGQRDTFERLGIAIDAARKRGEPLAHALFDGPPGLGKTTFATCIPRALGVPINFTSGAILKAPRDLIPFLTNATEKSVLFIDEIHRLPKAVEEYLYTAMEDFRIDFVTGEGLNARTINLPLKPFTLIGATTRAGMLSGPLRDRFPIREHLDFYSDAELTKILIRNAEIFSVPTELDAAEEIAGRSRGTPRVANNNLRCVRDYVTSRADGRINLELARTALKMWDIDRLGLGKLDRRYLTTLIQVFGGGPAGIEALAHTMNAASDTLADEVEPFLLRSGLIVRTTRGRVASVGAYEHLQLAPPDGNAEDSPDSDQKQLF